MPVTSLGSIVVLQTAVPFITDGCLPIPNLYTDTADRTAIDTLSNAVTRTSSSGTATCFMPSLTRSDTAVFLKSRNRTSLVWLLGLTCRVWFNQSLTPVVCSPNYTDVLPGYCYSIMSLLHPRSRTSLTIIWRQEIHLVMARRKIDFRCLLLCSNRKGCLATSAN